MESEIHNILGQHLRQKKSFAAYRLPGALKVILTELANGREFEFEMVDNPPVSKGFVMYPFNPGNNKGWWFSCENETSHGLDGFSEPGVFEIHESAQSMGFKAYKEQFELMKSFIEKGEISKVILSREIKKEGNFFSLLPNIFVYLCNSVPGAFVYLVSTPGTGTWLGATPEVLLKKQTSYYTTVALAGTFNNNKRPNPRHPSKETEEQQIVCTYIENVLDTNGVTCYEKSGPVLNRAGNVTHLVTTYNFQLTKALAGAANLVRELHPTPALCGNPRNKALEIINKVEKHDRAYYGGFLGPVSDNYFDLHVNIRCMRVSQEETSIFAGGGLTTASMLESEWEESILKSNLLISAIEQAKAGKLLIK